MAPGGNMGAAKGGVSVSASFSASSSGIWPGWKSIYSIIASHFNDCIIMNAINSAFALDLSKKSKDPNDVHDAYSSNMKINTYNTHK